MTDFQLAEESASDSADAVDVEYIAGSVIWMGMEYLLRQAAEAAMGEDRDWPPLWPAIRRYLRGTGIDGSIRCEVVRRVRELSHAG